MSSPALLVGDPQMKTASAPAHQSKPARAPVRKSEPDPDPTIHPLVNAIATSKVMGRARHICEAAEKLLEMLESFADEYTVESLATEVAAAGVEGANKRYLRDIMENLLHDVRGSQWAVESLVMCISSEVFEEDAGVLDDVAPKSR